MDHFVKAIIQEWATAKSIVRKNAALINANPSDTILEECHRRMCVFEKIDAALLDLASQPDLPDELTAYLEARLDKGCTTCWLTSALPRHPECERKIRRYFITEDNLCTFGLSLPYL